MYNPSPNIVKFNLFLGFVSDLGDSFCSEQLLPTQSDLRPTLLTIVFYLRKFIKAVIKHLVKTLSYLSQSVSTTVPWNKLWKEQREHMKTVNK